MATSRSLILLLFLTLIFPIQHSSAKTDIGAAIVNKNDKNPSQFIYEVKPGETVEDKIRIFNTGDERVNVRLYLQDGINTDGTIKGFIIPDENKVPIENIILSKWIKFEKSTIALDPSADQIIKFKITIPADAQKKLYGGAIYVHADPTPSSPYYETGTNAANGKPMYIQIATRVGTRLYLTVTDTPNPPAPYTSYNGGLNYIIIAIFVIIIFYSLLIIFKEKRKIKAG